ncbi:MAG: hypothetical protein IJ071_07015 [Ruminococcus sp.]|nr:hypothetical protein [Ruminococcus sp.]
MKIKGMYCVQCEERIRSALEGAPGSAICRCSPWAISAAERSDTEDTVTIPYGLLVSSKNIFANWK